MPLPSPSFMLPDQFSARMHYRPRGAQSRAPFAYGPGVSEVLGTTGWAFIRRAWIALRRIDWSRSALGNRIAYFSNRDSAIDPTIGTPFRTDIGQGAGSLIDPQNTDQLMGVRWDNDFNRALWAWSFLQWNDYTVRHGQPSAWDQYYGTGIGATYWRVRADTPQKAGWIALLNDIENCEVNQRVSPAALQMAATLVADSFGLIDSTTEQNVFIESGSALPRYNTDPSPPQAEFRFPRLQFGTWSAADPITSASEPYGAPLRWLDSAAVLVGVTGSSTAGPSAIPPSIGGGRPPAVARAIITPGEEMGLIAGYAIGGVVLVGGAWVLYKSTREET